MKLLAIILASLASVGCTRVDTFKCTRSDECTLAGVAGVCEPAGLCSFPDPDCPSGKAFGELAGDQADRCVDVEGTTDPTTTADPSTTTDPTTTTNPTTTTAPSTTTDPTTTADPPCTAQSCQPGCTRDGTAVDNASCDAQGTCQHDIEPCGLYRCDAEAGACRTKCTDDSHCISNKCMGSKCK